MAFFTYNIKFQIFKLVSFMPYTYIQGRHDGTRDWQMTLIMMQGRNLNFYNLLVVRIFGVFKSTEN